MGRNSHYAPYTATMNAARPTARCVFKGTKGRKGSRKSESNQSARGLIDPRKLRRNSARSRGRLEGRRSVIVQRRNLHSLRRLEERGGNDRDGSLVVWMRKKKETNVPALSRVEKFGSLG